MAKASGDHDGPFSISDDEDDEEDEENEDSFVSHASLNKKRQKKKKKKLPPKKKKAKNIWTQVWMYYWGAHQRFFRSLCISCKVPALLEQVEAMLLEGKCCVIGLQSTGEAAASQALADGEEVDDFISTPAAILDKVS
jgi:hypothetical protein